MSVQRVKGTFVESRLAQYLAGNGWPHAEYRRLHGALDQGDITGTPGVCWECKWAGGTLRIPGWLAETEIERVNARADVGVLVVKPKGLGEASVGRWWAIQPLAQAVTVLRLAGWGEPNTTTEGAVS